MSLKTGHEEYFSPLIYVIDNDDGDDKTTTCQSEQKENLAVIGACKNNKSYQG